MFEKRFRHRVEAGQLLGARLCEASLVEPVVLGLPRGGVVIAAEVAARLGVGFDVFVARKIGHPAQPELGLGAIAEGGKPTYDERSLRRYGMTREHLAEVAEAERKEVARRVTRYREGRPLPAMHGRHVVLVDDGVATGVSARAALQALRAHGPQRLVFAAPVGPQGAADHFADADDVVVLRTPSYFTSVGASYDEFAQLSDDEVLRLLATRRDRQSR